LFSLFRAGGGRAVRGSRDRGAIPPCLGPRAERRSRQAHQEQSPAGPFAGTGSSFPLPRSRRPPRRPTWRPLGPTQHLYRAARAPGPGLSQGGRCRWAGEVAKTVLASRGRGCRRLSPTLRASLPTPEGQPLLPPGHATPCRMGPRESPVRAAARRPCRAICRSGPAVVYSLPAGPGGAAPGRALFAREREPRGLR